MIVKFYQLIDGDTKRPVTISWRKPDTLKDFLSIPFYPGMIMTYEIIFILFVFIAQLKVINDALFVYKGKKNSFACSEQKNIVKIPGIRLRSPFR